MIKVNATIKKEFKSAKKKLGSFCAQYGYDILLPSSVRQEKLYKSKKRKKIKKYSKFKEEPFYRKPKYKKHKKYQNFYSKKNDEKDIKCFKCGKMGYIAPNCKIKEIIVDLDIGRHLKRQMTNLIKTESDSSSQSPMETSSDNQLLLIEESSSDESTSSFSQSSYDCVENCL